MRLADTLDTSLFHESELCAMRLDGDGFGLGRAVVPVDVPVAPATRAASLASAVRRPGLVVESWAAAWVHGAWPSLPEPLTLALDLDAGTRTRAVRPTPRETRFADGEVTVLGGVPVTSVFKTAFDFARLAEDLSGDVLDVVRALLHLAGLDPAAAATAAVASPAVPYKSRAFSRLLNLDRSSPRAAHGAPRGRAGGAGR